MLNCKIVPVVLQFVVILLQCCNVLWCNSVMEHSVVLLYCGIVDDIKEDSNDGIKDDIKNYIKSDNIDDIKDEN